MELAPGEIAIVGGAYEEFRAPVQEVSAALPSTALPVCWEKENLIPCRTRKLAFTIAEEIPAPRLLIPAAAKWNGPDGAKHTAARMFDDEYVAWTLSGEPGRREFDLPETEWETPVYLTGKFDADYRPGEADEASAYVEYDLKVVSPKTAEIILTPRRTTLEIGS